MKRFQFGSRSISSNSDLVRCLVEELRRLPDRARVQAQQVAEAEAEPQVVAVVVALCRQQRAPS